MWIRSLAPGNRTGLRGKRRLENPAPFPYSEERPWDIKRPAQGHLAHLEPGLPTPRPRFLPLVGDNHKSLGTGGRGAERKLGHSSLSFWLLLNGLACHLKVQGLLKSCRSVGFSGLPQASGPRQVDPSVFPLPPHSLYHTALEGKCFRPSTKVRFTQNDLLNQVRGSIGLDIHAQKTQA